MLAPSSSSIFLCLAAMWPTFAMGVQEATPLARTRDALKLQLEEARAAGIVVGRSEAPSVSVLREVPIEVLTLPAPRAKCLTIERLEKSSEMLVEDPSSGLDRLRASLLADESVKKADAELALAEGYLVLGFAEEARAIAVTLKGAEAAGVSGLALLAENRPEEAARHLAGQESCGDVFGLIKEVAAVLLEEREQLSDEVKELLFRLPSRLRQPIAEALEAHSLAKGLSPATENLEGRSEESFEDRSEAEKFISAASKLEKESAIPMLLEIGMMPGKFRIDALQRASSQVDDEAAPELKAGFEADSEDILADTNGGEARAKFSLLIAKRRADQGNLTGAAKALAAAFDNNSTRDEALGLYQEIISPQIQSSSFDDRLSAIAIILENPKLASGSLPKADMMSAAIAASRLGAVQATNRILSVLELPGAEVRVLKVEAAFRAGDFLGARAFLDPVADDPRAAELLTQITLATVDPQLDRSNQQNEGDAEAARVYWNVSEREAQRVLASKPSLTGEAASQAALAHLAADSAPAEALMGNFDDSRLSALFAKAPKGAADIRAASDFSKSISLSIEYMREALRNE